MATNGSYEILADELTLHKAVGDLRDPSSGEVTGVILGQGRTYFKGEVVDASEVSPTYGEILDDSDHPLHESLSKKLSKGTTKARVDAAVRFSLPFDGYDEAEEDDILAAMRVLPSQTVQSIKEYEREHENRDRIVFFNIGFGQSPSDREEGLIGGGHQDGNPDKAVANIQTREVPEEGPVQRGEGFTGTGDPQVEPGTAVQQKATPRNRRQRKVRVEGSESKDNE